MGPKNQNKNNFKRDLMINVENQKENEDGSVSQSVEIVNESITPQFLQPENKQQLQKNTPFYSKASSHEELSSELTHAESKHANLQDKGIKPEDQVFQSIEIVRGNEIQAQKIQQAMYSLEQEEQKIHENYSHFKSNTFPLENAEHFHDGMNEKQQEQSDNKQSAVQTHPTSTFEDISFNSGELQEHSAIVQRLDENSDVNHDIMPHLQQKEKVEAMKQQISVDKMERNEWEEDNNDEQTEDQYAIQIEEESEQIDECLQFEETNQVNEQGAGANTVFPIETSGLSAKTELRVGQSDAEINTASAQGIEELVANVQTVQIEEQSTNNRMNEGQFSSGVDQMKRIPHEIRSISEQNQTSRVEQDEYHQLGKKEESQIKKEDDCASESKNNTRNDSGLNNYLMIGLGAITLLGYIGLKLFRRL